MLDSITFHGKPDATRAQAAFDSYGMFVVRGLLEPDKLARFRTAIESMIRARLGSLGHEAKASDDLDALFNSLCDLDRKLGSQVYDHIKELPEYFALLSDKNISDVVALILGKSCFQMPFDLCLFRVDRPDEDRFTFDWHQDYPYNLMSSNAVTAWFPLTDIDDDMGRLKVVPAAHRAMLPVEIVDPTFKTGQGVPGGARKIRIAKRDYDDFETQGFDVPMAAGYVLFFHCLTPHRSGQNRSSSRRARWVMNPRFGDMLDTTMVNRGWQTVRKDNFFYVSAIHPDAVTIANQ